MQMIKFLIDLFFHRSNLFFSICFCDSSQLNMALFFFLTILKIVIPVLHLGFPGGSGVKICLPMQETRAPFLGKEHLLEKEMATHSSILPWEIPWKRNLACYSTWGHKTVGHNLMTKQEQNFAFPMTFSTMHGMYFMLHNYL